jgi:hypothetical protein
VWTEGKEIGAGGQRLEVGRLRAKTGDNGGIHADKGRVMEEVLNGRKEEERMGTGKRG